MGVVYLARHLRLGRRVALKVLVPELSKDELFRERFIRESQLAATLDHPNIIPIYDAGEVRELLYISMRYVEGSDLSVWLRRDRTLSLEDTFSVMGQIASALDFAHAEGLVHRDVKPANILTEDRADGGRRIFLTDFGVTKSLRREGDSLTRAGQLIGTIDYMAPEQITGQPVDGRTDVYSLGCIVYRCLTGSVPYPRDNEVAVMYSHLQDTPPPISSVRPELPSAADKVVRKAMAKAKDARFASCSEFIEALRPQLAPDGAQTTKGRRAARAAAEPRTSLADARRPGRRVLARRRAWLAGGAAAVVALAVLGVVLLNPGGTTTSPPASSGPTSAPAPGKSPASPATVRSIRLAPWKPIKPGGFLFGGKGDQTINRVIETPKGLLAVGYTTVGGENNAAVWIAGPSGGEWESESVDSGNGTGDQGMAAVAAVETTFVAVGSDNRSGSYDAAAWLKRPEANWEFVVNENTATFGGLGDQQMRRVVPYQSGAVAVGYDRSSGAVWNFDGTGWEKRTSSSFGRPGHAEEMFGVVASEETLVAVGTDKDLATGDIDPAAWWSTDGEHWNQASVPHASGNQKMTTVTVAPGGNGFVAVGWTGSGGDRDAAVWKSKDGRAWTPVTDSTELGGKGRQEMIGVITADGNLVAVGFEGEGQEQDGAVWTSLDGITWKESTPPQLGGPDVQQIKSVVQVGDRLFAVGRDRSATHDENAAVWVATITLG